MKIIGYICPNCFKLSKNAWEIYSATVSVKLENVYSVKDSISLEGEQTKVLDTDEYKMLQLDCDCDDILNTAEEVVVLEDDDGNILLGSLIEEIFTELDYYEDEANKMVKENLGLFKRIAEKYKPTNGDRTKELKIKLTLTSIIQSIEGGGAIGTRTNDSGDEAKS